jgi:hypothetical protein
LDDFRGDAICPPLTGIKNKHSRLFSPKNVQKLKVERAIVKPQASSKKYGQTPMRISSRFSNLHSSRKRTKPAQVADLSRFAAQVAHLVGLGPFTDLVSVRLRHSSHAFCRKRGLRPRSDKRRATSDRNRTDTERTRESPQDVDLENSKIAVKP